MAKFNIAALLVGQLVGAVGFSGGVGAAVTMSSAASKVHCSLIVANNPPFPLALESDVFVKQFGVMFAVVEVPAGGAVKVTTYDGPDLTQDFDRLTTEALHRAEPPRKQGRFMSSASRRASDRKQIIEEQIGRVFQKAQVRIYLRNGEIAPESYIKLMILDSHHWDNESPNQEIAQEIRAGASALFHIPFLRVDGSEGSIPAQLECAIER